MIVGHVLPERSSGAVAYIAIEQFRKVYEMVRAAFRLPWLRPIGVKFARFCLVGLMLFFPLVAARAQPELHDAVNATATTPASVRCAVGHSG